MWEGAKRLGWVCGPGGVKERRATRSSKKVKANAKAVLNQRHVHPRFRRPIRTSALWRRRHCTTRGCDEAGGRGGEEQGEVREREGNRTWDMRHKCGFRRGYRS
jgi:hypothetical protein